MKIQFTWQNAVNRNFSEATAYWIDYRYYLSVVLLCTAKFSIVKTVIIGASCLI